MLCYIRHMTRFADGEVYHICQRGVDGRRIFLGDRDYRRFLLGLKLFNTSKATELRYFTEVEPPYEDDEKLVDILGYILMHNHIHLLVRCKAPEGLTNFLRKNFGGYTMYFNTKNRRKGVLFQGRLKIKHIDSDTYLDAVINYIHLNALDYSFPEWREGGLNNKKRAKECLFSYKWSSLHGIADQHIDDVISLDVLDGFLDRKELIGSMIDWGSRNRENEIGAGVVFE